MSILEFPRCHGCFSPCASGSCDSSHTKILRIVWEVAPNKHNLVPKASLVKGLRILCISNSWVCPFSEAKASLPLILHHDDLLACPSFPCRTWPWASHFISLIGHSGKWGSYRPCRTAVGFTRNHLYKGLILDLPAIHPSYQKAICIKLETCKSGRKMGPLLLEAITLKYLH